MEGLTFDIKTLAAMNNLSITAFAEKCGIDPVHLQLVSQGRARMLATDLRRILDFTKLPYDRIRVE